MSEFEAGGGNEHVKELGNRALPIWQVMPSAIEKLGDGNRLVLSSPTGSGKSTQLPQALVQAGFHKQGKILVVQNRVAVAVEVAKRVADEMDEKIGGRVGYLTGPEKNASTNADIIFMTAGVYKNIMARNVQLGNPPLDGISTVIFDEFDERNHLMDTAVAYTEAAQEAGSPAKMILMSATLNAKKLSAHFAGAPVVEAQGRLHEVEEIFAETDIEEDDIPAAAAKKAKEIHDSDAEGDILIFMPGKGEIQETMREMERLGFGDATVLPLHSELSEGDRHRIFATVTGRKIIVSTDIAERGLTIDGVRYVIDSGLARKISYDPKSDSTSLEVTLCARDSLKQRAGRGGRTAKGFYHALFTADNMAEGTPDNPAKREQSTKPEIARMPLRQLVLEIKAMGFSRLDNQLRFLDYEMIDKKNWTTAKAELRMLGCLGPAPEEMLSPLGEKIANMGCDPRDGVMIVKAAELGCSEEIAIISAIRSSRPLLRRGRGLDKEVAEAYAQFAISNDSDLINMLAVYRAAEAINFDKKWCKANFVSPQAMHDVRQNVRRLKEGIARAGIEWTAGGNGDLVKSISNAIANGFPDKIFVRRGNRGWYDNAISGQSVRMGRESVGKGDRVIATKTMNGYIAEATRVIE